MRVRAPRRAARTHNAYATCTRRLGARLAAWNLRPLDIFCGPVGSGRVRFVCLVRSAYIIVVFVRAARPAQTIVHNGLDRECVAAKEQAHPTLIMHQEMPIPAPSPSLPSTEHCRHHGCRRQAPRRPARPRPPRRHPRRQHRRPTATQPAPLNYRSFPVVEESGGRHVPPGRLHRQPLWRALQPLCHAQRRRPALLGARTRAQATIAPWQRSTMDRACTRAAWTPRRTTLTPPQRFSGSARMRFPAASTQTPPTYADANVDAGNCAFCGCVVCGV